MSLQKTLFSGICSALASKNDLGEFGKRHIWMQNSISDSLGLFPSLYDKPFLKYNKKTDSGSFFTIKGACVYGRIVWHPRFFLYFFSVVLTHLGIGNHMSNAF